MFVYSDSFSSFTFSPKVPFPPPHQHLLPFTFLLRACLIEQLQSLCFSCVCCWGQARLEKGYTSVLFLCFSLWFWVTFPWCLVVLTPHIPSYTYFCELSIQIFYPLLNWVPSIFTVYLFEFCINFECWLCSVLIYIYFPVNRLSLKLLKTVLFAG